MWIDELLLRLAVWGSSSLLFLDVPEVSVNFCSSAHCCRSNVSVVWIGGRFTLLFEIGFGLYGFSWYDGVTGLMSLGSWCMYLSWKWKNIVSASDIELMRMHVGFYKPHSFRWSCYMILGVGRWIWMKSQFQNLFARVSGMNNGLLVNPVFVVCRDINIWLRLHW